MNKSAGEEIRAEFICIQGTNLKSITRGSSQSNSLSLVMDLVAFLLLLKVDDLFYVDRNTNFPIQMIFKNQEKTFSSSKFFTLEMFILVL